MPVMTIKTKNGLVPAKLENGRWVEDKGVKFVYDGDEMKAVPVTDFDNASSTIKKSFLGKMFSKK